MNRNIFRTICIALIFFPKITISQTQDSLWQWVALDSLVEVYMPIHTVITDTLSQRLAMYESDSVVYMAIKAPNPIISEHPITDILKLTEYYDGFSKGIIESTKGTLINEDDVEMSNLLVRSIKYSFTYKGGGTFGMAPEAAPQTVTLQKDFRENRLLYLDGKNYMLQYWYSAPESEEDLQNGEKFLTSLRTREPVSRLRQFDVEPEPEKGWMWKVLPWVLLVLVLAVGFKVGRRYV